MLSTAVAKAPWYDVAIIDVFSRDAFLWAEAVAWVMRRLGKPYVLALHGGGLPSFLASQPWRARRLLQPAAAVVAPSTFLKHGLQQYRDDILLIPNAIDIAGYHFRTRGPLSPRLVWLRAFHSMYAPEQAVEVLARVKRRFPTATLLMIGGDKGDGSLQRTTRLVQQLGLTTAVSFAGTIQKADVPNWLNNGDIFLNTTTVDNMPVSVIEAMACGLCVVSTNPAGIPHLLDHGSTALLAPVGDVPALVEAVERLLADTDLARQLSFAGRSLVEAFDWKHVLPRWERVLRSATQPGFARARLSGESPASPTPVSILETATGEMQEPNRPFPACVCTERNGADPQI
ncbi:MAG: glycosyltransferase family 4 protein [Bryobacterales bacterium]|nr:glycosyltransferase family 4 protein [Bryobacterales bacterium]